MQTVNPTKTYAYLASRACGSVSRLPEVRRIMKWLTSRQVFKGLLLAIEECLKFR